MKPKLKQSQELNKITSNIKYMHITAKWTDVKGNDVKN